MNWVEFCVCCLIKAELIFLIPQIQLGMIQQNKSKCQLCCLTSEQTAHRHQQVWINYDVLLSVYVNNECVYIV